jgi:hypothetical protein
VVGQENDALRQQLEGMAVQTLSLQADAAVAQQGTAELQRAAADAQAACKDAQAAAAASRDELFELQASHRRQQAN